VSGFRWVGLNYKFKDKGVAQAVEKIKEKI
jgi:hypothetical protein